MENREENIGYDAEKQFSHRTIKHELFEWLEIICTSIVAVVIIFTLLFRVITISGDSMLNTLRNEDKVIITNLFYTPKQFDVVVISENALNSYEGEQIHDRLIKRVIATEGQVVNIDFNKGKVYVDGVELNEPYTKTPTTRPGDVKFPVVVPEGHVFVLGDNRNESLDSRSTSVGNGGMVDVRYILGKAVLRVYPFDTFGGLK